MQVLSANLWTAAGVFASSLQLAESEVEGPWEATLVGAAVYFRHADLIGRYGATMVYGAGRVTMRTAVVERLTAELAVRRRAEIIEEVGGDEEAFRDRASCFSLDARELALFDELQALDYLLGR